MKKKPKAKASGIAVWCAHDDIVRVSDLFPRPDNPNKHPDSQIEILAKVIKEQGWRAPITISTRSGLITKGHGRMLAAIALGLKMAPVDYQHYGSDAEEMADVVADNRIPELAEIDEECLGSYLAELEKFEFDLDLTGYDLDDIGYLTGERGKPSPVKNHQKGESSQLIKEKYEVLIIDISEKQQKALLKKLTGEGYTCKALIS